MTRPYTSWLQNTVGTVEKALLSLDSTPIRREALVALKAPRPLGYTLFLSTGLLKKLNSWPPQSCGDKPHADNPRRRLHHRLPRPRPRHLSREQLCTARVETSLLHGGFFPRGAPCLSLRVVDGNPKKIGLPAQEGGVQSGLDDNALGHGASQVSAQRCEPRQ